MKKFIFSFLLCLCVPFSFAETSASQISSDTQSSVVYVNINQDDAEKLAVILNGVGPSIAQKIIAYRDLNGPFTSLDQLLEVKGFGPKKLEANRSLLQL